MANIDNPRGFQPIRYSSARPRLTEYLSAGSAAIYPGDVLKKNGSGRVLTITAVTDVPFGVAAEYVPATAGASVLVYDDLVNTEFVCQSDDASLTDSTSNGNFFDLTVTTGDTLRLISKQELDGNASVRDSLILVDKVNHPKNDWGANVDVIVRFRVDANATVTTVTA